MVHFVHDLKAHDPRDLGLRRILSRTGYLDEFGRDHKHDSALDVPWKEAWVHFLSTLDEIIWRNQNEQLPSLPHADWIEASFVTDRPKSISSTGPARDFSLPAKADIPFFELLERDPRPVKPGLYAKEDAPRRVFGGLKDERNGGVHMVFRNPLGSNSAQWQQLLDRWDIKRQRPVRQQLLVRAPHMWIGQPATSNSPISQIPEVRDVETANTLLQAVQSQPFPLAYKCEAGAKHVQPVVGFWLFPVNPPNSGTEWWKRTLESIDAEPQLALSCL
ncbi:hypothetical protein B0T14DRAFT_521810 [Immersiella caudata]|uniref:Uncharacterized protein n=1 Tax=Immersiella caudata TaxID=314043 RepID=A0AA39WSA8_9PEZI|nr:hypothetical protein B0T14DRAFT_521810 [Immersiella caudata]